MFICSVRAGTLRFFGAVLLALALFLLSLRYAAPLARAFDRMTAAISRRFSRKKEDGHEDP